VSKIQQLNWVLRRLVLEITLLPSMRVAPRQNGDTRKLQPDCHHPCHSAPTLHYRKLKIVHLCLSRGNPWHCCFPPQISSYRPALPTDQIQSLLYILLGQVVQVLVHTLIEHQEFHHEEHRRVAAVGRALIGFLVLIGHCTTTSLCNPLDASFHPMTCNKTATDAMEIFTSPSSLPSDETLVAKPVPQTQPSRHHKSMSAIVEGP